MEDEEAIFDELLIEGKAFNTNRNKNVRHFECGLLGRYPGLVSAFKPHRYCLHLVLGPVVHKPVG